MRPLSFITLTIAAILTVPIALWSVGLNPDWMLEVHLLACGVVVRLLVMSASLSRSVQEVAGVGLYGGGIGSLSAQIVLLSRYHYVDAARAFARNGALGTRLYEFDQASRWGPYAIALGDALLYGLIAVLAFYYVRRIRIPPGSWR
ncbi:MAG: hypothetical protein M1415_02725 [Firmicutes bacterium]|jgi:hypothetical protein|nr:hypothetical protein [Bacillota bacterium]